MNPTEYKNSHAKANYKHIHLKIPKHMTEVLEKLENTKNVNGYIIELIKKDIEGK